MPISAPLTQPQPNQGAHAQGALYVSQAVDAMKKAVAMVDPASPLGQAILDSLKRLSKEVGNVPADAQVNSLQSQLQGARQQQMQRMLMGAVMSKLGGMGGAMGGAAPGAANATPAPQGAAA